MAGNRASRSRILQGIITDRFAKNARRIIETFSVNDIAPLSCLALAILTVVILQTIGGYVLATLLLLLGYLIWYFRMTGMKVRLAELSNEAIRLRLIEAERIPQPSLPGFDVRPPRHGRGKNEQA